MTSTPTRLLVATMLAGVLVAGCGSESKSSSATSATSATTAAIPTTATQAGSVTTAAEPAAAAPAGNGAVTVKQFQFMPGELLVKAGTAVTWTNEDEILHTSTSGATPGTPDGQFDGPMDGRGKSFTHTFSQPGRYPYFCSRHTSMTGTVVVQ